MTDVRQLRASPELASVSDLGKGNGYARTRLAGMAANSLNIKDNRKSGVREGVSNVETVEGVGVKCRTVDIAGVKAGSAYRSCSRGVAPKLDKRVASLFMLFCPL